MTSSLIIIWNYVEILEGDRIIASDASSHDNLLISGMFFRWASKTIGIVQSILW